MIACFSKDDFFFVTKKHKMNLKDKKIESLWKRKRKRKPYYNQRGLKNRERKPRKSISP